MEGVCVDGAIHKVASQISALSCMEGAWAGVLTAPETLKAYGTMVENVGLAIRANVEAHRKFIKDCDKSIECRRELARGLAQYNLKKANGDWWVSDSEVDKYVKNLDVLSLINQTGVHQQGQKRYCEGLLSAITQKIRSQGLESDDFAMARFQMLAAKEPQCLGTMKMLKPSPNVNTPVEKVSWAKWFAEKGVQIQCYPPGKISELVCYQAAALVADPLVLTGAGVVSGKVVAKMLIRAGVKPTAKATANVSANVTLKSGPKLVAQEFEVANAKGYTFAKVAEKEVTTVKVLSEHGQEVGIIAYHIKGKTLAVDAIRSNVRREGISAVALGKVLKDNPNITVIETKLAMDNKDVARKFLQEGMNCQQALMQTPAYKIRARYGYTKVIRADCTDYTNFAFDVSLP